MCTAFLYPKLPGELLYTQGKRMGCCASPCRTAGGSGAEVHQLQLFGSRGGTGETGTELPQVPQVPAVASLVQIPGEGLRSWDLPPGGRTGFAV